MISNRRSEPLTWETVERLRESGSYGSAEIAERILRKRERGWKRWLRRKTPSERTT